jgi:hypothetical protein
MRWERHKQAAAPQTAAATGSESSQRTPDIAYDLVSVIYHSLQGCQTYEQYAQDAEQEGQQEVAQFR